MPCCKWVGTMHMGTRSLSASSRCQCYSSWLPCPKAKKGQEFVNSNHQILCMSVWHAYVPAPLQLISTTVRFVVWSHSAKSAPLVVMIAPGTASFVGATVKGSCSRREGRQALASPPPLLAGSVHAWVPLRNSIWSPHPCGVWITSVTIFPQALARFEAKLRLI